MLIKAQLKLNNSLQTSCFYKDNVELGLNKSMFVFHTNMCTLPTHYIAVRAKHFIDKITANCFSFLLLRYEF